MTGTVISPVVLPANPAHGGPSAAAASTRPLPLPAVPSLRTCSAAYGLAAVDSRGRVADRAVFDILGWVAGTPLAISTTSGTLVVRTDPSGVFAMTGQGHLRLPAAVRHCCGLSAGDRVLLVAHLEHGVLLVHPPAVLDHLLADLHATLLGGDRA